MCGKFTLQVYATGGFCKLQDRNKGKRFCIFDYSVVAGKFLQTTVLLYRTEKYEKEKASGKDGTRRIRNPVEISIKRKPERCSLNACVQDISRVTRASGRVRGEIWNFHPSLDKIFKPVRTHRFLSCGWLWSLSSASSDRLCRSPKSETELNKYE